MPTIHALVTATQTAATTQTIPWDYNSWLRWLPSGTAGPAWPAVLSNLHAACARPGHAIIRSDVAAFGMNNSDRLFLAAMVWGYGTTGYGPYRTGRMLASPGFSANLAHIVNALRTNGAGAGFTAVMSTGRPRIPWLGPSYGSKLLYFAGDGYRITPQPLIYDAMVAKALNDIAPGRWPTSPGSLTACAYEQYCLWAEQTALTHGVRSPDVEYALFSHGRSLLLR